MYSHSTGCKPAQAAAPLLSIGLLLGLLNSVAALAKTPDFNGTWTGGGDPESVSVLYPGGGGSVGVGWAPLSSGEPEERFKRRPSKAERDARVLQDEEQLKKLATQDEKTRLQRQVGLAPMPAATPAGQKAYEALNRDVPIKFQNEHCYAGNVVSGIGGNMTIAQTATRMLIAYENGYARIIHLNSGSDADAFPGMFGYSIGKWQGDTLVVNTTKIAGRYIQAGLRAGWPMSENITLTEYFKKSADGKTLSIKRVMRDPLYYREPLADIAYFDATTDDLFMSPCAEGLANQPYLDHAEKLDSVIQDFKQTSKQTGSPK